jgi:pyridoxine 5-phosphate synthase
MRLGINIDHIATLRNARGGSLPDPLRAVDMVARAGGDLITAHLREDRRHIRDADMERLVKASPLPINMEMAVTAEMQDIACRLKPHAICLVPERRAELTTEGGLNVLQGGEALQSCIRRLQDKGMIVSLFIDPDAAQIEAAARLGAKAIELHTGSYAGANGAAQQQEIQRLQQGAKQAAALGLDVHAGHGLDYENTAAIAAIPEIQELNIGHFLIGEAVFVGLENSVRRMKNIMQDSRERLSQ